MSSSKQRKKPSYNFPEDILAQILKRLPVKYVLRCTSVQKSWYHLIKTPMFVSLHINHQKIRATHDNDHPKYLFFLNMRDHLLTVRFDDVQCQEYGTLKYPLELPNHAWYALANGLICVSSMLNDSSSSRCSSSYNFKQRRQQQNVLSHGWRLSSMINGKLHYDPHIYLWNPLVQKYKTLPDSPVSKYTSEETCWKALAFGFLPEVNDYVVVHIVKPRLFPADSHSVMIGVYSLNTNSWKKISQDNVMFHSINDKGSVFVDGAAFWVVDYGSIMCFDTKTDILREIMVPYRQWSNLDIYPFGQSIACFLEGNDERNYLDPRVLKDNASIDEFDNASIDEFKTVRLSENVRGKILGVRNNGELILSKLSNLISYDLNKHKEYDFAESCDQRTPFSYYDEGCKPPLVITPFVETLLWLDTD